MTTRQPVETNTEPEVMTLLRRQAALFDALGTLSRDQRGAIEQGSPDAILSLLARRQQVVEQLTGLAGELEPYRVQWAATRDRLEAVQREEADRLVAASEQHLEGILERDEHDRSLLQQARQKAGEELTRINRSGQAMNAYGATPPVGMNRYTDRCG